MIRSNRSPPSVLWMSNWLCDSDLRWWYSRSLSAGRNPGLWQLSSSPRIPADTHSKYSQTHRKSFSNHWDFSFFSCFCLSTMYYAITTESRLINMSVKEIQTPFWTKSHAYFDNISKCAAFLYYDQETENNQMEWKKDFMASNQVLVQVFKTCIWVNSVFIGSAPICLLLPAGNNQRWGREVWRWWWWGGGHKRIKERSGEGMPLEKHLIHWALSVHTCLNQTRCWYLETPVLWRELLRPCLLSDSLPPPLLLHLSLFPLLAVSLRCSTHLPSNLPAPPPLLSLQIVSKACLCSISARASPVIGQLQRNQLQAF